MGYNVRIQNEQGEPLRGTLYFFDSNNDPLGEIGIGPEGWTVPNDLVAGAAHYRVEAPGYSWYGTSTLYDNNVFTLVKLTTVKTGVLIVGGALAAYLLIKLLKL